MKDRLKQLNGLLVLKSPDGELLGFAKNLVLKQGYQLIIDSFTGSNVEDPALIPEQIPFIDTIKVGNSNQQAVWTQTELLGSTQMSITITNLNFFHIDTTPVVEVKFHIPANSQLANSQLGEVGLYSSSDSKLFSRVALENPIQIQQYTTIDGYYFLSTGEIDPNRIFDDSFDQSFE